MKPFFFACSISALRDIHRLLILAHGKYLYALLLAVDLQLLNRSRTIDVTGYQQYLAALAFQLSGQLGCRGGFTGSLKTHHHQNGHFTGVTKLQLCGLAAHQGNQFLMDNLYHLLSRRQTVHHIRADGAFLYGLDKLLDYLKAYVGFQKSHLDFL